MTKGKREKLARPICVHRRLSVDPFFLLLFAFFFLPVATASAATYSVPTDFPTIQAAIDAAIDGDEVIVSPGTYIENIHFHGKNIVLRSTDPDDLSIVESTVIDGNRAGTVVTFEGTESAECVLRGFTITHGRAMSGGGINGWYGAATTIEDNIITENEAGSPTGEYAGEGGGLFGVAGVIGDNVIKNNDSLQYERCYWDEEDHYICDYGGGDGGAIWSSSGGTFSDNLIIGNSADGGDVVFGGTLLVGNYIVKNNGSYGIVGGCHAVEENFIGSNGYAYTINYSGSILNNIIVDSAGVAVFHCGGSTWARVEGNLFYKASGTKVIVNSENVFYNVLHRCNSVDSGITSSLNVHGNYVFQNGLSTGILCIGSTDVTSNIVAFNKGVGLWTSKGVVLNNTIYGNAASNLAGGMEGCSEAIIKNNIVWGNTSPTGLQIANSATPRYCCIESDTSGEPTNISVDPGLTDPVNGDFSLRPDSPCIDAGAYYAAAVLDAAGRARGFNGTPEPRGDGSDFDIGAYEYVGSAEGEGEGEGEGEWPYHKADQNGNGRISLSELLRVVQFYNADGYRCVPGTEDGYAPGKAEDMRKRMGLDRGLAHASPRFAGETCLSPRPTTSPEGVGDRHVGLEDSPACASPLERTEAELFARRREPRSEPSPVRQWREERRKQREEERTSTQSRRERGEEVRTSPFVPLQRGIEDAQDSSSHAASVRAHPQRGIEERAEDGSLRCVQSELSRGESVDYASLPSSPSPPLKGDKGGCSSHTTSHIPPAKSSPSLVEQYMTKYEITLPEIPDETLALWETAKAAAARARATGETLCVPHSSDYAPQDWSIGIIELMRLIQFYNMGGYHACPDAATEDGFCPGAG